MFTASTRTCAIAAPRRWEHSVDANAKRDIHAADRGKTPAVAWRFGVFLALAFAFLLLDQVSKVVVRDAAAAGAFPITVIPGVIDFDFVMNTGVAFGLARGFGYVFVALAAVIVIASCVYLWRSRSLSWFEVVGLGLLAGGAIGNAIDRALFGFVTDFIATTFIDFPVFNIADIGITVGVVIAFAGFMLFSPAAHESRGSGE